MGVPSISLFNGPPLTLPPRTGGGCSKRAVGTNWLQPSPDGCSYLSKTPADEGGTEITGSTAKSHDLLAQPDVGRIQRKQKSADQICSRTACFNWGKEWSKHRSNGHGMDGRAEESCKSDANAFKRILVNWYGTLEFEQIPLWKGLLLGKRPYVVPPHNWLSLQVVSCRCKVENIHNSTSSNRIMMELFVLKEVSYLRSCKTGPY